MNPRIRKQALKVDAYGMKMWKGNGNTTTLLFFLKRLKLYIKKEEDK